METKNIRVTVWNEYLHEKLDSAVAAVYPHGIHGCIADFLQEAGMSVRTATPVSYTHLDVYKRQVQIPSAYLLKLFFHEVQQLGIGQHVVGLILKLIKDFLQGGQCVRILFLADIL